MSESKEETPAPKRGSLAKKIILGLVCLVALIVVAFFVVTSGGFIRSFVLPKVGAALHAELTVQGVELSPFSQLVLREVKLTPNGKEQLLTASLVRARYDLMAILRGKIAVEEVTVEAPTVTLVQNPDGSSNLDPLTQGDQKKESQTTTEVKTSPPPQIDIKNVALKNATVKITRQLAGGARQSVELANVNISAANLKNGGTSKLSVTANINLDNSATNGAGSISANLGGDFALDLSADLKPAGLNGKANLKIEQTRGAFSDFSALAVALEAEASPTEVKQLSLGFTQAGQKLGELRVSGPFDPAKMEGKLNIALLSVDRRVLNLAGTTAGIDFGTTLVNSTNVVELTKAGAVIAATGQLDATRIQVIRQGQTTPTLDLRCDYAVTVDNNTQSAQVRALNLTTTQDAKPLLQTELTSPLTVAWGKAENAVGDATLKLTLTRLNLSDWRAFAADTEPSGIASATLKLLSQQGGKRLSFDLDANAVGLSARFGSNSLSPADLSLQARGSGSDLKQFKLDDYLVAIAHQGQSVARLSGNGTFSADTKDADLQFGLQATVTRLLSMFPQPGAEFSNGTIELNGRATSKAQSQSVSGKFLLAGLTGKYVDMRFADFGTAADLELTVKGDQLDIRQASGDLREGSNPGGSFGVSGNFDIARKAGQFSLALTNINQNALRPFLESALGDKKLVSVALNTTATARLDANGDAAVKANVQLANLVVNDPKGTLPSTPLEAKVAVDVGVAKSVAKIAQCQLTLTPTTRAKNELNLAGAVDYSKANAISGSLKLSADSIDVTRYYDLFAGPKTTAAPTATKPAPTASEEEPAPVELPLRNFAFNAAVGKFFLREVEASSIQVDTRIDGGHIMLKPLQLALNGAPVNATADLDLGVRGYKYDISLTTSPIPLTPLVNSFVPERKDQIHGVTVANAKLKGAGITGPSLRKNLSGEFGFASTNLDLAIPSVQSKLVKEVLNVIVGIPELIRNPVGTLGNLLTRLTGGTAKGGFAEEITDRPIESIAVNGRVAEGLVNVNQAEVRSPAFVASAAGEITLNDILTNSTIHFPVHVALSRSIAEKAGLAGSTPTNQAMVTLPDFLTMKGTIGKPDPEKKPMVLVALAAQAGGGIAKQTGSALGEQVGGLLNVLTGSAPANNQSTNAAPNASPQPAQAVGNLLRGIGGLFNKPKTAPPATNAPPK